MALCTRLGCPPSGRYLRASSPGLRQPLRGKSLVGTWHVPAPNQGPSILVGLGVARYFLARPCLQFAAVQIGDGTSQHRRTNCLARSGRDPRVLCTLYHLKASDQANPPFKWTLSNQPPSKSRGTIFETSSPQSLDLSIRNFNSTHPAGITLRNRRS